MKILKCDVLIIGSGFGGAPPALRLAKAGMKTIIVEKGPNLNPFTDFKQTQDPKYLLKYLKGISNRHLSMTYAEALGGGSGFYEMVSLRAPSMIFNQTDNKKYRLWPRNLTRSDLDPYYDIGEKMLQIEQIKSNEVPKTGQVFSLLMKKLGYSVDRARYAVKNCIGAGYCITGCIYGAKQSLHLNYLPQAVAAGAEIHTDMDVKVIRPLTHKWKTPNSGNIESVPHRFEVICFDRAKKVRKTYQAKILILAGGTVGTAKLLLKSKQFLPFLSDQVGRNICFNGSVKALGILPDWCPDGDMFTGRTHPGMISYHFLDSHGITISAVKPMLLQVIASAHLKVKGDKKDTDFWGQPHVDLMKKYRHRLLILYAIGMTPPSGRLILRKDGKTKLLSPLSKELKTFYKQTKGVLDSILTDTKCQMVEYSFINRKGKPYEDIHFFTTHQVGSCRMANSPRKGVADSYGGVFGYSGMYITDGAAIPSSLSVNTSLTILANSERITHGILDRYKSRTELALKVGQ